MILLVHPTVCSSPAKVAVLQRVTGRIARVIGRRVELRPVPPTPAKDRGFPRTRGGQPPRFF